MLIRRATEKDIPSLISLWRKCFFDTEEYIVSFYRHNFDHMEVWVLDTNHTLAGMVHLFPASFSSPLLQQRAFMAYAIGVAPVLRGQGLMQYLLNKISTDIQKQGAALFLMPANDKLKAYYQRLGFCECSRWNILSIPAASSAPPVSFSPLTSSVFYQLRNHAFSHTPFVCWDEAYLSWVLIDNHLSGGFSDILTYQSNPYTLLGTIKDSSLLITETSLPYSLLLTLSSSIAQHYRVEAVSCRTDYINDSYPSITSAMSRFSSFPSLFSNLMLD